MATNSRIQWTQDTWNPWHGCAKITDGGKYCYMHRMKSKNGEDGSKVLRSKTTFSSPLYKQGSRVIFTCSMSDWFLEEADPWRAEAWYIIKHTPHHIYQILTKRPERIGDHLPADFEKYKNVWLGVSVESQKYVNRVEYLIDLPCITFASFEPLIGPIVWDSNMSQLDWCIIGGESGNDFGKYRYRPKELNWAEDIAVKAKANGVACFVKQLGTYQAKLLKLKDWHGGNIEEFPDSLKIREFPVK